jgi:hypothetical protein
LYGEQELIGTAHQNELLQLSYPAPGTLRPILETSINDDVRLDRKSAERNSPVPFVQAMARLSFQLLAMHASHRLLASAA